MNTPIAPWQMPQGSQNGFMQQPAMYSPPYQPPATGYAPMVPRQAMLHGRIVRSAEEIVPQEVPMDGSVSVYPLQDWSKVYVKWWTPDGLQTAKFVAEQNATAANDYTTITARLDKIEKALFKNKAKPNNQTEQNTNT